MLTIAIHAVTVLIPVVFFLDFYSSSRPIFRQCFRKSGLRLGLDLGLHFLRNFLQRIRYVLNIPGCL